MTDKHEKRRDALGLFYESVLKPDHQLRECAHNQECYHELMEIRDQVIEMVREMPNPHTPPLEFGKKNSFVTPTVTTPAGEISETLMNGSPKVILIASYSNKVLIGVNT